MRWFETVDDDAVAREGIRVTAKCYVRMREQGLEKSHDDLVRYASGAMKRVTLERERAAKMMGGA